MRPSGITDGIVVEVFRGRCGHVASMRPSGITDGIIGLARILDVRHTQLQ